MAGTSLAYAMVDHIVAQLQGYLSDAIAESGSALNAVSAEAAQAITAADNDLNYLASAVVDPAVGLRRPGLVGLSVADYARLRPEDAAMGQIEQLLDPAQLAGWLPKYQAMLASFKSEMDGVLEDFTADLSGVSEAVDAWATGALGFDFSPDAAKVRAAWDRARDRAVLDNQRANGEMLATWAAKGYPLPPGAAAHQQVQNDLDARNKIADINRQQAEDFAKTEVDAKRLALEHQRGAAELLVRAQEALLRARAEALRAVGEYMRTLILRYQAASEIAGQEFEARSKLASLALAFYKQKADFEELPLRVRMGNADRSAQMDTDARRHRFETRNAKISVMQTKIQGAAQRAAAAVNALHAQANVSGNEPMVNLNL